MYQIASKGSSFSFARNGCFSFSIFTTGSETFWWYFPEIEGSSVVPFITMQAAMAKIMMDSLKPGIMGFFEIISIFSHFWIVICNFFDLFYTSPFAFDLFSHYLLSYCKLEVCKASRFWYCKRRNSDWDDDCSLFWCLYDFLNKFLLVSLDDINNLMPRFFGKMANCWILYREYFTFYIFF